MLITVGANWLRFDMGGGMSIRGEGKSCVITEFSAIVLRFLVVESWLSGMKAMSGKVVEPFPEVMMG